MKFVEIYRTQKRGPAITICRLAWDSRNKRIIPLLNSAYAKALFEGSYFNKVTKKRVHPTHSLKFLKSLHDCFLNLSYVRASKLKRIKGLCNPLKKVRKGGSCDGSFDLGYAGHTVNPKEVEMSYGENKMAPSQENAGQIWHQR